MEPQIAIIVAKAEDNGIGCSDGLPWHIPEELKYFKSRTLGKPVIMGRNTFLSLGDGTKGKPLPGRDNIVLTRGDFSQDGIFIKHSLEEAIEFAKQCATNKHQEEIMIIGGSDIFKQAIKWANVVYLTQIKYEHFPDTNAFLPPDYLDGWKLESNKTKMLHENKLNKDIECSFEIYKRA